MINYGNALYIMLCAILSLAFLSLCKASSDSVVAQGKDWDYIYWGSYFNASSFTITTYTEEWDFLGDGYVTIMGKVICIGSDDFINSNAFSSFHLIF